LTNKTQTKSRKYHPSGVDFAMMNKHQQYLPILQHNLSFDFEGKDIFPVVQLWLLNKKKGTILNFIGL
jgi:hypothetical protein